jgi:hypothetical protein
MHVLTESLRWQSSRSKAGLLLGSVLFVASVVGARADAVEALQGAWVMEFSDCTGVFEKVREEIRFKDRNYANDMGFIISGSKVMGPIAGCTISQVDEDNDRFSALLSCSDALVSRKFSWSFTIIDATHFERLDPEHPDFPTRYKKCVF